MYIRKDCSLCVYIYMKVKMSSFTNNRIGDPVESEIIHVMREKDYSLDAVNNYGDDFLHVTAANGCYTIIREILKEQGSRNIDTLNDNGWSPLMLAIRNGKIETVKLLLESGCNPDQSTFQGISAVTLSVAISREMFEIIYAACPAALEKSKNDTVNPLCVAAMTNDKELFFRLLELGLNVSDARDYTLLMISRSTVPEIASFGDSLHNESSDYWNVEIVMDDLENLSEEDFVVPQMSSTLQGNENSFEHGNDSPIGNREIPKINISSPGDEKANTQTGDSQTKKLHPDHDIKSHNIFSPRLQYTRERTLAMSPNLCFARRLSGNDSGFGMEFKVKRQKTDLNENHQIMETTYKIGGAHNENRLHKFQMKRPADLQILQIDDYQSSNNETPVEPRYNTPPMEMASDQHQQKMASLLKRFGLTHFIPLFLREEIDVNLFLTLNLRDLEEIGIEKKSDRIILQSVIDECNRNKFFMEMKNPCNG